jgi:AcrR family transcriptional regulator
MSSQTSAELTLDQQILAAAQRLLVSGDETALTMDRLAAESGISRATIYRRFGGRTALLKRLADEHGVQFSELEREADIRSRILQAARAVIHATGSINFTIEQVAAEAGVGVATIYRHFGTKENLLQSTVEQFHPRQAAQELLAHASEDIEADLQHFAQTMLQFMQGQAGFTRLLLSGDSKVQQLFRSVRTDQERTLNSLTRYLEAQMKAGRLHAQDPFNLSAAFLGMIIGFAFIKPTYTNTIDDPQQTARFIVQLFLAGIQRDNP